MSPVKIAGVSSARARFGPVTLLGQCGFIEVNSQFNFLALRSAASLRAVRARAWLSGFKPARTAVNTRERTRAALGAAAGILLAALVGHELVQIHALELWLMAPLGASAVLVFAVPGSPLAQPWPVLGGNTLSALVGVACVSLIDDPRAAAALAVGLAVTVMFAARCLHPPGGATALLVVLNQVGNPDFAIYPVALDSLLLVIAGIVYNSLTGRPYPHRQSTPQPEEPRSLRFSSADLDAALAHYNQVLDVSRDDLEELFHDVELAAYRRNLGSLSCADVMSASPHSVGRQTPLSEAHTLMHANKIKSLPVTDKRGRVIGIVTAWDILERMVSAQAARAPLIRRIGCNSAARGVIAEVMSKSVSTAGEDQPVVDLVRLFSQGGHHHIPIVDSARRLVGIITQSDLIRALYRAVRV